MNTKKLTVLSTATLMLAATSVSSVIGLSNNIFADEIETKADTISNLPESKLFTDAVANTDVQSSVNVSYDGVTKIRQLVDKNQNVLAAEISNPTTSEVLAVKRTATEVIVEKTTKGYNGQYEVNTEHHSLATIEENTDTLSNITPRNHYTAWRYTNIAVGVNVFAVVTNLATSALVTFVAGVFGITTLAADALLEYMGAKGLSSGEALASALDTSGNGWIGLYVREIWNDSQTSMLGTQYKTM